MILDIGSGSGIVSSYCKSNGFKNIISSDIDPDAIRHLKKKGLNPIKSDLFEKLDHQFDLIIFNPPYLPFDIREPKDSQTATTGGRFGYELILRFLDSAINHIKEDSIILLLYSSLSHPKKISNHIKNLGLKKQLINKKSLFFEKLYVYKITI